MSQRYIGGVVTETTNVAQAPWTGEWTQQAALQGFAGAQAPLRIANSLRFRSSASAYLNRTPSVAGNRQTWTWSGWVKLGSIGTARSIFSCGADGSNYTAIDWRADNRIQLLSNTAGIIVGSIVWDPYVWRDPSAWYHLVIVCDTTNATQTSRFRFYMNGVQYTGISSTAGENTYPAQNANTNVNNTVAHSLGRKQHNASEYFDGYLAEINFIDGQALTPASFGQYDANGIWQPIAYTGTYGTNGFRLNFSNGTSTTTLGYDSSGNSNNWTTNNISLTAGSTYDWMIDSPTKYPGSSYGVGNYAVLNAVASDGTTSNANLTVAWTSGGNSSKPSTIGMSSGKWYCEIYMDSAGTAALPGLIPSTMVPTAGYPGSASGGYGYYYDGQKYTAGTGSSYGASYTNGDVIGVAFDADAGSLTFYKNGVSQGVAFSSIAAGTWFFAAGHSGSATMSLNFGQRPFAYTPPSGYKSLCTQNLPVVTIYNGAQYMAATTYTGTGSSVSIANTVNGVNFQPDFVWIKSRSGAGYNHILFDTIRGATKYLSSNATTAETTNTGTLTAFNSNGFTVSFDAEANGSGQTFVGWQWKAGGTAVTNTAGSITSSVSANTTAGFSVVTYTGNGTSGATIGHGLGIAPSMVIAKKRNDVDNWMVYHSGLTSASYFVKLNATSSQVSDTSIWNGTAPSSSVFTVGSGAGTNQSSSYTYVAYCFAAIAGYSAFGSYTGNGSSDGPFVYLGFRPRFIMMKVSSASGYNWEMVDTARNVYNPQDLSLYANLSAAEDDYTATYPFDFLSNGFKPRGTSVHNASGQTYIYACFAENPFQNALAR